MRRGDTITFIKRLGLVGKMSEEEFLSRSPVAHSVCRKKLDRALTEDDFIDVVHASIRGAKIAGRYGFYHWKNEWKNVKYDALINAAKYAVEAGFLRLDMKLIDGDEDVRIQFRFQTALGRKDYLAFGSVNRLMWKLGGEEYQRLFGHLEGALSGSTN